MNLLVKNGNVVLEGGGGEILKTRTPQGSDCICWFRRGDSVRSIASELVFFSHPPISPALSQGRQGMPIYPKIAHHNTRVKDKEWQSFTAPLLRCCSLWSDRKLHFNLKLVFWDSYLLGLLTFCHLAIKATGSIKIHNAWGTVIVSHWSLLE